MADAGELKAPYLGSDVRGSWSGSAAHCPRSPFRAPFSIRSIVSCCPAPLAGDEGLLPHPLAGQASLSLAPAPAWHESGPTLAQQAIASPGPLHHDGGGRERRRGSRLLSSILNRFALGSTQLRGE